MAKEKKRTSPVWTVFTKTGNNRAKCQYCQKEISFFGGTTGNLTRHLRKKHSNVKLNPPHDEQRQPTVDENGASTAAITVTTQTSSNGVCIATVEPFEVTSKFDEPDESEDTVTVTELELEFLDEPPLETDKRKKSDYWSVFRKVDDHRVCCKYCGNILSTPKGYTSNLKRHVKLKHPKLYASLKAKEIEKKKATTLGQTSVIMTNPNRMSQSSMSLFAVAEQAEVPQDMLKIMEDVQEKIGFVPNAYQALSHRPNEMRAFLTYYDTTMEDRLGSHLTKTDKEMILVAVSAFNKCKYFIIAHSGLLRIYSKNKYLADQLVQSLFGFHVKPLNFFPCLRLRLHPFAPTETHGPQGIGLRFLIAANWETADIDERQRCILKFAMKVTKCEALMLSDFKDLEIYGLDSEDAWDIGSIASFCSLSNRMAFLTNMTPNEQFYSLGRSDK